MALTAVQYKQEKTRIKRVYYTGTDTLKVGHALCYDRDTITAEDQDWAAIGIAASSWGRHGWVEKPASGNLHNFAGIVAPGSAKTGPTWIDIQEPGPGMVLDVFTAENCTEDATWLTVQAASYLFGALGTGVVVGRAVQTVNRSSVNGLVQAVIDGPGPLIEAPYSVLTPSSTVNAFSKAIWETCPWNEIKANPTLGTIFFDDFMDLPTGRYTATQATAGTFALIDGVGGLVDADCASSTVVQGINVQAGGAAGANLTPAAANKIWFECRLKVTDSATGPEFFVGLSEIDTTIIATSAMSSTNVLAFSSVTDDNVLLLNGEKAGTGNTETGTTLVEATYVNLGLVVAGVTTCTGYVNGTALGTALVTANIPIVALALSLVCQSNGTTDPIVTMDWWRAAQLR